MQLYNRRNFRSLSFVVLTEGRNIALLAVLCGKINVKPFVKRKYLFALMVRRVRGDRAIVALLV